MQQLRREPFRVLFPLALLIGGAGMLPWLLFGRGLTRVWPGPFHSVTMTQAFLVAVERLMGMLLVAISVQMLMDGIAVSLRAQASVG